MSDESPDDIAVFQLRDGDLASEGSIALVEDVLSCDFDVGGEMLSTEKEEEGGRSNDDFGVGVYLAISNLFARDRGCSRT